MAQWKNTMIRGILDVTDQYCISENGYNLSKISNSEQIIGEITIDSTFTGKNVTISGDSTKLNTNKLIIKTLDKYTIGVNNPETSGAENGQIYFKIIN